VSGAKNPHPPVTAACQRRQQAAVRRHPVYSFCTSIGADGAGLGCALDDALRGNISGEAGPLPPFTSAYRSARATTARNSRWLCTPRPRSLLVWQPRNDPPPLRPAAFKCAEGLWTKDPIVEIPSQMPYIEWAKKHCPGPIFTVPDKAARWNRRLPSL
jgi:hypothetical protein